MLLVCLPSAVGAQVTAAGPATPAGFPLSSSARAILCAPRADVGEEARQVRPVRLLQSQAGPLRRMYAPEDTLVISGGSDAGLTAGQLMVVRRPSLHRLRPSAVPRDVYGTRTLGIVMIEAVSGQVATARAIEVCEGFIEGDWLDPYSPAAPVPRTPATDADFSRTGLVLFGDLSRQAAAPGDMVVVDRGTRDDVIAGDKVTLYRETIEGGPVGEIATGVVVDVRESTATIRIEQARDAVFAGDRIAFHGR